MENILNTVILNNPVQEHLYAFGITIGLFIIFRLVKPVVIEFLKKIFAKTKNDFDDLVIDLISNISKFFYWATAFYFGSKALVLPENIAIIINYAFITFIAYEVVYILRQIISYFIDKLAMRRDSSAKAVFHAMDKFAGWLLWLVAILILLSNFGVDITAMAAGLGIGGLAIAFAIQGILKDLFSYFTILLDRPIRIGDYIYLGDKKGKVKNIGIKTTRLEAVDGEEIIIANDIITGSDFRNFGKTKERRVVYNIGAAYDTPVKKLKQAKKDLIKIIESFGEDVELHRCHLRNMGDSSLNYEIVYNVKTRDYSLHMDINEEINFKILELFEKKGIEIPFPTQTIYTKKS